MIMRRLLVSSSFVLAMAALGCSSTSTTPGPGTATGGGSAGGASGAGNVAGVGGGQPGSGGSSGAGNVAGMAGASAGGGDAGSGGALQTGPITGQQAILQMQRGINLGNTFDAPGGETAWGNPVVQDYYFDDYKAAGFQAVRIPVTWDQHTAMTAPYAVDDKFLSRVEQVVDWGLSRGLFIIVNAHHEAWLKESVTPEHVARFAAIWTQVAARFQGKSDRLLFEILNEPHPMSADDLTALNSQILGIMRQTNPTRLVVYAGTDYSGDNFLEQQPVPVTNDPYLIANFHCYSPWTFVSGGPDLIWGSPSDRAAVSGIFDGVAKFAAAKGLPVMVNEFGAGPNHDYDSRMSFYQTYVDDTILNGMAFFAWDDGGDFRTYDRQVPASHAAGGHWIGDVKDEMTANVFSPAGVKAVYSSASSGGTKEASSDVGGGKDVGQLQSGDWLNYLITVPEAGTYQLELRVASANAGARVVAQPTTGGTAYATFDVPATGGAQTWSPISQPVTLSAGVQYLQIKAQTGPFSLSSVRLSR